MTTYKAYCEKKAKNIDDFLAENADPGPEDILELKRLNSELIGQFNRMEAAWDSMMNEIDDPTHTGLEKMFNNVDTYVSKTLKASKKIISEKSATTGPAAGAASTTMTGNVKIDDTLKPRQELLRSFTLEEANIWFDGFIAYFNHNEKVLARLTPLVHRQLLNNSLGAGLAAALQTDDTVKVDTPILGKDGCLSKLKAIFLEKNPLFLRRHRFQQCRQTQGETVAEWWIRKKAKARECELDKINMEDVLLLELIRGVRDPKLKEEFLKQKEPTLNQLIQIAERWQTASHVSKDMDEDSVNARKTSNYKAGKADSWAKDAEERSRRSNPKDGCNYCGRSEKHGRADCPAKDKACSKCNKKGHFGIVCRSSGREQSQSRGKGSGRSQSQTRDSAGAKSVRVGASRVEDDSEPTPLMKNVVITPQTGTPFQFNVFPDTGCYQSLVSLDLVTANGMVVDTRSKKTIRAVNGIAMNCTGSVVFQVAFEGHKTDVLALVTSSLREEILLSWRTLQRLGIIREDFPHVVIKAKSVSMTPKERLKCLMEEHSSVFEVGEELKTMKGEPMHIHLKDEPIRPLHICNPRKTPYAFQDAAKAKLDEMEALGIVEKFNGTSDWCSAMSFVPKADGKVRSVVDLVHLNKFVERPTHPFPTPRDIIAQVPQTAKCFAVFDALHGYWQIPLDQESKPLTTFITEFGCYRYLRAPMGLTSSGDEFCARTDKALSGIPGVHKLVDDILVYGKDQDELMGRIKQVFTRCEEWGITLSKEKHQFGNEVKFAGYILNAEGTRPDPDKVAAIGKFPEPTNLTDLRSFMGLVNQFADFAPDLKHAMLPLKGLLSKKNAFVWTDDHGAAMIKVKEIITDPNGPVLRHFDPKLPIKLLTDASRTGIGYILTQEDQDKAQRMITCGSRFLNDAEKNYAVVELELLAIQWAVQKCRLYLAGSNFKVITDHQPLIGIMNGKNLDAINNARIQRMMSKLLGYSFKVEWIPGKNQCIADALSRSPVFAAENHADILVCKIFETILDPALEELSVRAKADIQYQAVVDVLKSWKPLKFFPKDHPAQNYKSQWDAMSLEDTYGFLLYHGRIIVPEAAKKQVLASLHLQHTGESKTLMNARQLYYWPRMTNDIKLLVSNCKECIPYLPSQPLEPQIQTTASRPFESVSIDLGTQNGTQYLIFVDRYSGWPLVRPLKKLDTKAVTSILDDWFLEYGKPVNIRTDGGPQFRSEFTRWCEDQGIRPELSSANHHESNGHAECGVQEMKHLLGKTASYEKFRFALREWRNTPRYDGLSPSQWLFGRRQRTEAVAIPRAYDRITEAKFSEHEAQRGRRMDKEKSAADQTSRSLEPMKPGDVVYVQNPKSLRWDSRAKIVEKRSRRSYIVEADGRTYLRNRKFLRPCRDPEIPDAGESKPTEAVPQRYPKRTGNLKRVYFQA